MSSAAAREALAPTCAAVTAVLTDPPSIDPDACTPCTDFDLRELIEHFVGTSTALARLGQGQELDADDPWGGGTGAVDGDWAARLRTNLDRIRDGWGQESAWEGEAMAGGSSPMPRSMLGEMALIEVALHGWDLARALDRTVELDAESAAAVHEAVAASAELGRQMGAYGPEVSVPPDASSLHRALGKAGRDPVWGD